LLVSQFLPFIALKIPGKPNHNLERSVWSHKPPVFRNLLAASAGRIVWNCWKVRLQRHGSRPNGNGSQDESRVSDSDCSLARNPKQKSHPRYILWKARIVPSVLFRPTNFIYNYPRALALDESSHAALGCVSRLNSGTHANFGGLSLRFQDLGLAFHQLSLSFNGSQGADSSSRALNSGSAGVRNLRVHSFNLLLYGPKSQPSNKRVYCRDVYDDPFRSQEPWKRFLSGIGLLCVGYWLAVKSGDRWINNNMRWWDWLFGLVGILNIFGGAGLVIFGHLWPPVTVCAENQRTQPNSVSHVNNVSQKLLDMPWFLYYSNYMANVLSTDKQIAIIGSLCEGSSIRSIERLTGVHRDTIMRLGVKVGQGCTALMDSQLRDLSCERLEMDEIWGFIGKKEKRVRESDDPRLGDVWTFCAIDADTKLVPAFKVGKRDNATATAFVDDVAARMRNRVQISTDGLKAYVNAIESAFGSDVDYAQIIKTYGYEELGGVRRYSAPEFVASEKRTVIGWPNVDLISTSYVERLNATTRLHMRRLTRLTLAFSKKFENFEAAVGLHFAYYNFVKRHNTLRQTPAMAAGVARNQWSVADLVEASA
jgi:IS1 family transposase